MNARGGAGASGPERMARALVRGGRLIVANIDCELAWAGAGRLPGRVATRVSAAATAVAVFARAGDVVWTPAPVDQARLGDAPWTREVLFANGDVEALPQPAEILAWGETAAVARLRAAAPPRPPPVPAAAGMRWHELLWSLPSADPAVAARCNHRRFAFEIAAAAGDAPPGARFVSSLDDLDAHLRGGGADTGKEEAWVLKAPHSAAGRDRLHHRGRHVDVPARVRIARLLSRFGTLLFEPWSERIADFGVVGAVTDGDVILCPPHRLEVDRRGLFRGVVVDDAGAAAWFETGERDRLAAAAAAAGDALLDAGYRGPFGIDAFAFVDEGGRRRFRALCELNARLSFGLVARAIAQRTGDGAGDTGTPSRARLVFGPAGAAPRASAFAIVRPSAGDPSGAWLCR